MSSKKALKSIRGLIESGEYQSAVYEATDVLKSLQGKDAEAAQVLVFRGLALTNLNRKDEAEKCYIHAYKLQPENPLASVGLRKLYEKEEQWQKLARLLEVTIQRAYNHGDADGCAAALQELLLLRQERGPEDDLYSLLRLFLPSSPLVPFLQSLPAPQGSFTPFPAPIYPPRSLAVLPTLPGFLPHVLHLLSSLPLLLNLLIRSQGLVHQRIEAQVKVSRTRLTAGPEKEVRKRVEGEVLGGPLGAEMIELLREVGSHAGVEDSVRRDVEVKEFEYWRRLVGCLSAEDASNGKDTKTQDPKPKGKGKAEAPEPDDNAFAKPDLFKRSEPIKPTKAEALLRADGLANGFILLGVVSPGAEEGWTWVIEGTDEPFIFYNLELLHKFANAFPESPLFDFIDDYCRWFHLPLPQSDESDSTPDAPTELDDKKKKRWGRPKKINAKERRRLRRVAHRAGNLSEDIDQEERDELVASMTKLLEKLPKSIFAHRAMARVSMQEEDWASAVGYAEKARILVKELEAERGTSMPQTRTSLDTSLGVALVPYFPPKHHSRATRLLNGVLNTDPTNVEARFARGQIYQTALKWSQAREHFQMIVDSAPQDQIQLVSAKEEVAWCLVNDGKLEEGRQILEEIVELRDARWEETRKDDEAFPRARAWWRLGQTEWLIGGDESRTHAEDWFMASIRALSTYAPAYTSLGIAYLAANPPDDERALKCFQKAFELDATEIDAAQRLAKGYADDDEWALVRLVANRVMEGEGGVEGVKGGDVLGVKGRLAPQNGWAWKALGSTEMHYRNYTKAAQAYQIALRADPDDSTTWTQLGESYARCGRHMAGLKALQKALELDPQAWVAWYDIGDINIQLGSFEAAIDAFDKVTSMAPGQVGVIAKMAESYLSLGRAASAAGYRERARRAFERTVELACDVLGQKIGHRPWGWKVIGDACFELGDSEGSDAVLQTALKILVDDDSDKRALTAGLLTPDSMLQSANSDLLANRMAVFAYTYRSWLLKNEPRVITLALYDLTTALRALSSRVDGDERKTCQKAAIGHIRNALDRDAGDERLWNALAVLCGDGGEEVAQHAFVISLELYAKDPMVWTNLGYLYLRLDNLELASECFLKAQTTDPDYARAWLGQGLIAKKQGDKPQAGALFAHAVTLSGGALLEADLASAMLAFEPFLNSSLLSTSDLHATAFALRHYVHQRPSDAAATHLFGLMCERIGLIDEAADAFELATQTMEHEFEVSESPDIEKRYLVALVSLGRVKLALGKYDEALKSCTDALELARSQPSSETWIDTLLPRINVQCLVAQGVAHFWLGQVDEALAVFDEAYKEAGNSTTGNDLKEYVAVPLARTLWGIGADEARETAKTHLMECLSSESPSIAVVTNLAAIALISSDDDLTEASVSELCSIPVDRQRAEDPQDRISDILVSSSLIQSDVEEAKGILEKALQHNPSNIGQRIELAKLLISTGDSSTAETILDGPINGSSSEQSRLLYFKGMSKIMRGDRSGMGDAQKAIMVCPWDADAWKAVSL